MKIFNRKYGYEFFFGALAFVLLLLVVEYVIVLSPRDSMAKIMTQRISPHKLASLENVGSPCLVSSRQGNVITFSFADSSKAALIEGSQWHFSKTFGWERTKFLAVVLPGAMSRTGGTLQITDGSCVVLSPADALNYALKYRGENGGLLESYQRHIFYLFSGSDYVSRDLLCYVAYGRSSCVTPIIPGFITFIKVI